MVFSSKVIEAFQIFFVFAAESGIYCYYLQTCDEFTSIIRYQPIYNHTCLMIAESSNWKVVCDVV